MTQRAEGDEPVGHRASAGAPAGARGGSRADASGGRARRASGVARVGNNRSAPDASSMRVERLALRDGRELLLYSFDEDERDGAPADRDRPGAEPAR